MGLYGLQFNETAGREVLRSGIPFYQWEEEPAYENSSVRIPCGFRAAQLYILGNYNAKDIGTGGWWEEGADRKNNLFVGDRIGTLRICYADGGTDVIPYIQGITSWWSKLWNSKSPEFGKGRSQEPFVSNSRARAALEASLHLGGVFTIDEDVVDPLFYLCVAVRAGVTIEAVELIDDSAKNGYPVVKGITADLHDAEAAPAGRLVKLTADITAQVRAEAERIRIDNAYFTGDDWKKRLDYLDSYINLKKAELPLQFEINVPDDFRALHAPHIVFRGGRFADMLTNVYYHNVAGMLDKTDTDGRCYCSSGIGGYGGYWGFGTYSSGMPDHLLGDRKGFGIGSWSRDTGVVIAELAELGLIERANRAGDWNLMISYMAQPPHWSEQGNFPDGRLSFYQGNEERFIAGRRETGNRENDGQGLIILALYHIWIHYGRKTHWVRERYCQIRDNVDFISMQLHDDTPVLNHFRDQKRVKRIPGILYTESECSAYGRSEAEIYSNYICYAALLAGAEFAARAGDDERAAQYRADASCMRTAMAEYFTENDPVYGRVWKLTGSIWPAQSETLAPAFIHQDLYGMNGMDLEGDFREISRNTLKKLIGPEKRYDWANAMGYGQAFITEAAIYLDDRETYTGLVETAAMVCYNPIHKGWEWHIPEGAIISDDGEKWHKLGDLGNAVQQASIMKCIRMLAGIDDTVPEVLQLIPRLPFGWDAIYVTDYPVAIPDGEMTKIVRVDFTYTLTKQGCRMELHAESPIPLVKCRLSHLAHASYCRMNGCDCAYEVACDASGASHIWIKDIKGQQTIVIEAGI